MKTRLLYLLINFSLLCTFISCEDNDPADNEIKGEWACEQIHFEYEYLSDTLRIITNPMQPPLVMEVKKIKPLVMQMASLLKKYFQGIHIGDETVEIKLSMGPEKSFDLQSSYRIDEHYLEIIPDPDALKQLTGGKDLQIPPVSLCYRLQNDGSLLLYLNKGYIGILIRSVMGNEQMRNRILPMIIPNYDKIPERILPLVIESLNTQITGILDNTVMLEIGFLLSMR